MLDLEPPALSHHLLGAMLESLPPVKTLQVLWTPYVAVAVMFGSVCHRGGFS